MECNLAADVNQCTFYHKEHKKCNKEGKCSFQSSEDEKPMKTYIRKERWHEKYYKTK